MRHQVRIAPALVGLLLGVVCASESVDPPFEALRQRTTCRDRL
jgi:hypothetical protein